MATDGRLLLGKTRFDDGPRVLVAWQRKPPSHPRRRERGVSDRQAAATAHLAAAGGVGGGICGFVGNSGGRRSCWTYDFRLNYALS